MNGDTMEELYAALTQTRKDRDEARWLNRVLTTERDEARREVCKKLHRYPEYIAQCRGWDCYEKETK